MVSCITSYAGACQHHTQAAEKTLQKVHPAYAFTPFFCVQLHVFDVVCWINPCGFQHALCATWCSSTWCVVHARWWHEKLYLAAISGLWYDAPIPSEFSICVYIVQSLWANWLSLTRWVMCACSPQTCCVQHLVTMCLQKEEEVRGMQAELHSVLTGVRAARHEQQEEHWKIAQLKHQHEDTLQVPLLNFCSYVLFS